MMMPHTFTAELRSQYSINKVSEAMRVFLLSIKSTQLINVLIPLSDP